MENLTPFTKQGDFHITNTWTLGPLSEMSYDEKMILKMATKREIKKLHEQAETRFDDSKNKSLMISDEDHQIRNEAMRRIAIQQLKKKHIHDFQRRVREQLMNDRRTQPGFDDGVKKKKTLTVGSVDNQSQEMTELEHYK